MLMCTALCTHCIMRVSVVLSECHGHKLNVHFKKPSPGVYYPVFSYSQNHKEQSYRSQHGDLTLDLCACCCLTIYCTKEAQRHFD